MRKITVAVTVDDRMGIAFNNRRQSSDRILIRDLMNSVSGNVYVSNYSAPLFSEYVERTIAVADVLSECPDGSLCFAELQSLSAVTDDIGELIVYRWNRHYPSDMVLDIDLESGAFELVSTTSFVGSSHEEITKEIYIKAI